MPSRIHARKVPAISCVPMAIPRFSGRCRIRTTCHPDQKQSQFLGVSFCRPLIILSPSDTFSPSDYTTRTPENRNVHEHIFLAEIYQASDFHRGKNPDACSKNQDC